jgi:uncharacterized protein (DUF4415 family)
MGRGEAKGQYSDPQTDFIDAAGFDWNHAVIEIDDRDNYVSCVSAQSDSWARHCVCSCSPVALQPVKTQLTLRLDPDVVEHFKASGPGWTARINEVLRKAAGLKKRA